MKVTYSEIPKAKIKRRKMIKYKRVEMEDIVRTEHPITHEINRYDGEGRLVKYYAVEVENWSSDWWGPEYGFAEIKDDK